MAVRTRIAPSPTGYFHVGTARTALFNWLVARQCGGAFLLRIEDTDLSRNQPEQIEAIQRAMRWLRLDWDEGPFLQSQRRRRHLEAIDLLIASGHAYGCDCSAEQVAERARARGGPPGYDGFCRDRGLDPSGRAVRFRTPETGEGSFEDLIRGHVVEQRAQTGDFVIRKSNGDPLFVLANVVDDADMAISHVIRGADHVTNTHKYVLVWEALGFGELPVFAHAPLLTNSQRKKLSKRRDKVAVEDYRDEGYLPEAFVNYLALLGWSPGGDREVVGLDEMVTSFRLADVNHSDAVFDERKLAALNAEYLRAMPSDELLDRASAWLRDRVAPIAPLVQERSRTLAEVWTMSDFLYRAAPSIDADAWARSVGRQPAFAAILSAVTDRYQEVPWTRDAIRQATAEAGEAAGVTSLARSQEPVRLAVTGRTVGPPLFESLELLGRGRTLTRLADAAARLAAEPAPGSLPGASDGPASR